MNILESLRDKLLVADGAFGTCYAGMYGERGTVAPELANMRHPERVLEIHKEYVKAGAGIIRTNTFAANTASLDADMDYVISNVRAAVKLAKQAVAETGAPGIDRKKAYVAGDIGPIPADAGLTLNERVSQYKLLGEAMQDMGVDIIWFETFPEFNVLEPVVKQLKARKDTPVMVSFCVNQFGYSNCGFSARALLSQAAANSDVDCVGLNCGVGPYHMLQLLKKLDIDCGKPVSIMPNAGYPKFTQSRLVFNDNKEGFVDKIQDIAALGADIIGGCCGTNPEYIRQIEESVKKGDIVKAAKVHVEKQQFDNAPKDNFLKGRLKSGETAVKNAGGHKLIAVELAPPVDVNDQKLLDAAHILKQSHVDVVTFPDSPSGRTRADSILMAEKVHKETGLRVMPHLCCRDKNAIAIRGSVLGAQLNGIKDFLVITGDPVPVMFRQTTRSVFNFDSVGMMKLLQTMNEEVFIGDKITYGGAINQNRINTKFEIDRIKRKLEAGAEFFLSQTSLNLGILKADVEVLRAEYSVRSSVESEKDNLIAKLAALVELTGGDYVVTGDYPGWKYRVHSPLREKMVKLYAEMYGTEPKVEAIHAGLECGLLGSKITDLDCVSMGPDMKDIHTTEETLSISSTKRVWEYLVRVLETKD